jgi:hypothetical protein
VAQSSREIYWSAMLADFRRSGLTHVQFCNLRQISIHSFRDWLYRLRPGLSPRRPRRSRHITAPNPGTAQTDPPAFLPVHVRPQVPTASADRQIVAPPAPLELVLGEPCHLRVPVGFDPTTLHQLLDVLEQRS